MVKPKLLILSSAKNFGGGEVYLKRLLPELTKDYEVTVFGPHFANKFFKSEARTVWLPLFPPILDRLLNDLTN